MAAPPLIIGAGSIGLLVAHLLARRGPVEVLARGATLRALRRDGFAVRDGEVELRHTPVVHSWRSVPRRGGKRTVILAVKALDLVPALRALSPLQDRIDSLFLLQNGLGIWERAEVALPGIPKVRMACYTGVTREACNAIRIHGRGPFGLAPGPRAAAAGRRMARWLEGTGFPLRRLPSPSRLEWEKAAMNLVVNGLATLADGRNGVVLGDRRLRRRAARVLAECQTVARARWIDARTPDEAAVFAAIARVRANLNSTLQDLRAGRPTEVPWLHGTILAWADAEGLAIPETRALHAELVALELSGALLRAGAGSGPPLRSRSRRRR